MLEVAGRHRERFLHSQLTSDVRSLPTGSAQLSALLDPSGRLCSFCFLYKLEEAIRLLVPRDVACATKASLEEHVISDDVRIAVLEVGRMSLLLGPQSEEIRQALPADRAFPITGYGAHSVVVFGEIDLSFPPIPAADLEGRRVLSGLPSWGVDAAAGMLVNQSVLLDTAVSFTKGCYLGQETVAKVASRRGAAYAPMLLKLASDGGDPLVFAGRDFSVGERDRAGRVVSGVLWDGDCYLVASLWRELRVEGTEIRCRFDKDTELVGRVSSLPLITTPSAEDAASGLFERAVVLFAEDLEDEAIQLLRRAIAVCPGFADAYECLGVMMGRHGRYQEAIGWMDRLLQVDPDSVMARTNKSVYLNQLGRNDEAEEEARAASAKSLELSRRRQRATTQEARRREDEREIDRRRREEMFRQVLTLDPGDAMANFGMGQLLVERSAFRTAVEHLERALETDPEYSAALLSLGNAWEGLRETTRAREVYEAGIVVAARKGDMKTANAMQARLAALGESNEK